MTTHAYPAELDSVWIASDSNSYLGVFVTGGVGPIPIQALNSELLPIGEVEKEVCNLPKVSNAQLLVSMPRPDDFVAMAERGFFVYDWRDVHRTDRESTKTYEQIAVPRNPIQSDALPEILAKLVANVRFSSLRFAEEKAVNVRLQFECKQWKSGN